MSHSEVIAAVGDTLAAGAGLMAFGVAMVAFAKGVSKSKAVQWLWTRNIAGPFGEWFGKIIDQRLAPTKQAVTDVVQELHEHMQVEEREMADRRDLDHARYVILQQGQDALATGLNGLLPPEKHVKLVSDVEAVGSVSASTGSHPPSR